MSSTIIMTIVSNILNYSPPFNTSATDSYPEIKLDIAKMVTLQYITIKAKKYL